MINDRKKSLFKDQTGAFAVTSLTPLKLNMIKEMSSFFDKDK
jgi:hypothetical protein